MVKTGSMIGLNHVVCFTRLQKEQMLEAKEMFRTSNKVTRPEKALILGFIAGSRGLFVYLVHLPGVETCPVV